MTNTGADADRVAATLDPGSFRDPTAQVLIAGGHVYRGLGAEALEAYEKLERWEEAEDSYERYVDANHSAVDGWVKLARCAPPVPTSWRRPSE